jgi:hypothetical protein
MEIPGCPDHKDEKLQFGADRPKALISSSFFQGGFGSFADDLY